MGDLPSLSGIPLRLLASLPPPTPSFLGSLLFLSAPPPPLSCPPFCGVNVSVRVGVGMGIDMGMGVGVGVGGVVGVGAGVDVEIGRAHV